MWRTWLTRLAQAAGVVQAGVGQTGRRGAGGRAAGGVCGTSCGFRRVVCGFARGSPNPNPAGMPQVGSCGLVSEEDRAVAGVTRAG